MKWLPRALPPTTIDIECSERGELTLIRSTPSFMIPRDRGKRLAELMDPYSRPSTKLPTWTNTMRAREQMTKEDRAYLAKLRWRELMQRSMTRMRLKKEASLNAVFGPTLYGRMIAASTMTNRQRKAYARKHATQDYEEVKRLHRSWREEIMTERTRELLEACAKVLRVTLPSFPSITNPIKLSNAQWQWVAEQYRTRPFLPHQRALATQLREQWVHANQIIGTLKAHVDNLRSLRDLAREHGWA